MYEQYCLNLIDTFPSSVFLIRNEIALIKFPTEKICNKLINKYGDIILRHGTNYFTNLDENIAIEYVDKYPYLIKFITNQTPEMCKKAIKYNSFTIKDVKNQTLDICKYALLRNSAAISNIKNVTPELLIYAMNLNKYSWQSLEKITYELYVCLLDFDPVDFSALYHKKYTEDIWENITIHDINRNKTITHIMIKVNNNRTSKLLIELRNSICNIKKEHLTYDLCKMAIENNAKDILYVPDSLMTEELCKFAIDNGATLNEIDEYFHTLEFCVYCLKKDIKNIIHIKNKKVLDILDNISA